VGRALPFRFGRKYIRKINALGRDRAVPALTMRIDPEDGGERIVAFAQPGKPPENPILWPDRPAFSP
jgi:hypothetical protein